MPVPAPQPPSWIDVLDHVEHLAETIANTSFVPKGLRGDTPAILAAILRGREIGLEPMDSLASISVIDGRPSLSAEAQRGLILQAGHEFVIEEATNSHATVAGRRRDSKQWTRVTWSLDDAKRARIAGKPNWQAYPRQMLVARASAELARQVFPDVIRGLVATEELEGDVIEGEVVEPEPQPATKTRQRRRTAPTAKPEPKPEPEPEPGPEPAASESAGADAVTSSAGAEPSAGDAPVPPAEPEPAPPDPASEAQFRKLFALFGEKGITDRAERLKYSEAVLGRPIGSSRELSSLDATRLIEALGSVEGKPLPPEEQAVIDEAKDLFDATEVPTEEGGK